MTPQRIQLRRAKGWRKPEGAIVVARPTRFGNPYRVQRGGTSTVRVWWAYGPGHDDILRCVTRYTESEATQDAVDLFVVKVLHHIDLNDLEPLRGHDLACWCPLDQPCHADVLLEWANR